MPFPMIGVFLLGLALMVMPAFTDLGLLSGPMVSLFGLALLIGSAAILIVTKLYHKTSADEAFVRTGGRGLKTVIDGGAVVIPFLHNITLVSLATMRLEVERKGENALITGDKLRADVSAEFFIKVQKDAESVKMAATSLGHRMRDPRAVEELVQDKLISALRDVAATKTLQELNSNRKEFASAVEERVSKDLQANGLHLESVTISALDQTPLTNMRPDENVFDAEGAKTIAEITQKNRVARNMLETEADKKVKEQEVERDQSLYKLDVLRAEALAQSQANQAKAAAVANQESRSAAAEQDRIAGVAEVHRDQAIRVAEVEREQGIAVANQLKEQAERTAQIEKEKATQVADQLRESAVEQAKKDRAAAETERKRAEEELEKARQAVLLVEVEQTAEREKAAQIIAKQAEIERARIEEQMKADVVAYTAVTTARGEKEAAENRAAAKVAEATANRDAQRLQAEGERAHQMVPVEVNAEQVEVNRKQVEVDREALKNQAEFESIARQLQVELATIDADKATKVAAAAAMGEALANAKMNIFGDPTTVAQMSEAFYGKLALGQSLTGLINGMPDGVKGGASTFALIAAQWLKKSLGVELDPEVIAGFVQGQMRRAAEGTGDGAEAASTQSATSRKESK